MYGNRMVIDSCITQKGSAGIGPVECLQAAPQLVADMKACAATSAYWPGI